MNRSIFGAAAATAVMLSFCAQAQESPVLMQASAPILVEKTKTSAECKTGTAIVSPLAGDRGSLSIPTMNACGTEKVATIETKTVTTSHGYAAAGDGRGQIQAGNGDRGSFISFLKAEPASKKVKVKAKSRKSTKVSGKSAKKARKSSGKATKGKYGGLIASYAKAHGVPVRLANAVVRVESNYRANARGAAGEIGLMQLKLSTARMMGYRGSAKALYNPETNIKYGMKYLAKARKLGGGSTCGTILKYNAGHGAKRMNPISARYCSKVKRYL